MAMTASQNIQNIPESGSNAFDNTITVTDIPKGYFIALTANDRPDDTSGSTTRNMRVDLMAADWANEGTQNIGSGLFMKASGETAICVKVYNGSTLECENTSNYP